MVHIGSLSASATFVESKASLQQKAGMLFDSKNIYRIMGRGQWKEEEYKRKPPYQIHIDMMLGLPNKYQGWYRGYLPHCLS
jgi:hypothetical protein